jgi:hypothetical protein
MFFSGTGVQISAISRVDYRNVGSGQVGEGTIALRKLFDNVVHGRSAKYRQWCHPVFEKAPDSTSTRPAAVSVK